MKDGTHLLSICHGDLADHSANVDEEVEILVEKLVILTTRMREKIKPTIKMRDVVSAGLTTTRSPDLVCEMKGRGCSCCSATRGEMFALKPPVPRPMIMRAIESAASAPLGSLITGGRDEMIRTMWPMRTITTETTIALNRPHFSSAR